MSLEHALFYFLMMCCLISILSWYSQSLTYFLNVAMSYLSSIRAIKASAGFEVYLYIFSGSHGSVS